MDKHQHTPDILSEIFGGEEKPDRERIDLPVEAKVPAPRVQKRVRSQSKSTKYPDNELKEKPLSESQFSTPGKKRVPVKEFEYRLVTFQEYKGWRARFVNGVEIKNWSDGELIHQCLLRMGEEGWELVAACAGERMYGSGDKYQLYFKRLRE